LTKVKHFGVRNNIEKGKGELTFTNCFKVCGRDCVMHITGCLDNVIRCFDITTTEVLTLRWVERS